MHDPHPAVHDSACPNCGATLSGPYCAQCGQHAHESARSLHVLFHDAWHLFTHLDGLFWITLQTLLLRPGRLTREYFADRRARYVPPFRLYFVISVAFFGLTSLGTSISNLNVSKLPPQESAAMREEMHRELASEASPAVAATVEEATSATMSPEMALRACDHLSIGMPKLDQHLQSVCRHQVADEGKSMLHAFAGMVPKMMFVFLPLMALLMLLLYHSPPRYYVEHLVFFLHLQSALFLAMILEMLLSAASDFLPSLETLTDFGGLILVGYSFWYVYAAMRNYYGQSGGLTLVKYFAVGSAYLGCFVLSLVGTVILSALLT
jgi:Protein of unknown function (DUF3667)